MESTDYNTHANLKWKQKQFPWIGFRIYTAALSCSFTCFCVFFRFSNVKHSVCFLALPLCTRTLHLIQFIFACVYSLSSESQEQIGRFFLLARLSTPCICNAYMHIVQNNSSNNRVYRVAFLCSILLFFFLFSPIIISYADKFHNRNERAKFIGNDVIFHHTSAEHALSNEPQLYEPTPHRSHSHIAFKKKINQNKHHISLINVCAFSITFLSDLKRMSGMK